MSNFRGKLFYRLIQQAVEVEPVGLNDIVGKSTWPKGISSKNILMLYNTGIF
jgi:hypothetical protein